MSRESFILFFFIFFSSLFDIQSFDRRNSSGQEQKFIYSTRATREYQKHGISSRIQVKSSKKNLSFEIFTKISEVRKWLGLSSFKIK